ncbi:cytochrome-c peroxidase [Chitinophaga niastensis]|nr:cytochrome c peroxidase [Chitinophaga niastensis]
MAWTLKPTQDNIGLTNTVEYFRAGSATFAAAALKLQDAISAMDAHQPQSITSAKNALRACRQEYKKMECFMDYFFYSSSLVYNRPPKIEVEEPYMEYQEPTGLQQIAALLFDKDPFSKKEELLAQTAVITSSSKDLGALLYQFTATDKEIMESLRLELVRIYTLSITGYDAPELKSGIQEAYQAMTAIQYCLQPFLQATDPATKRVSEGLAQCIQYLQQHPDFDTFNRLEFLSDFALPLQENLSILIQARHLYLHTRSALNYDAKNLFSKNALNPTAFPNALPTNKPLVALGKKLFFEKALSGNLHRNCATCHQPEKYFSDGLPTSIAFDGKSHVKRNAPSLYYAGFQYAQFWDGREKNLTGQIENVIRNPTEMNGIHQVVIGRIKDSIGYQQAFKQAFPATEDAVTMQNLSVAIAAFINTLAPMSAPLDDYFAGNKNALTPQQINGFNLFMGKAQCGTCHFAPLFNGLTPPLYQLTEYENTGLTANDNFQHPQKDNDAGRFDFFSISFYQGAFKTPTVRNAAMTAPYMHNGVFKDLEKVMEFYNAGGGAGLGLVIPDQTLSGKPLGLSSQETKDIIAFIQALTDKN